MNSGETIASVVFVVSLSGLVFDAAQSVELDADWQTPVVREPAASA